MDVDFLVLECSSLTVLMVCDFGYYKSCMTLRTVSLRNYGTALC